MASGNGNSNFIVVKDLVKHYVMGDTVVEALRGVSFEIDRASFVAIMGPSGSGKTTLMDILGCLSRPTDGDYCLDGVSVGELSENRLAEIRNSEIGFVFQNFNLLPRTTALGNVELPLLYEGTKKKDRLRRAEEALGAVGLKDRMLHRPSELSGGQRQRVAIARALVNNPSIVLADEPTGNLDTVSGNSILALFKELHKKGNTIVIVTHEREVAEYADRIMSFRDGLLVRDEWRDGRNWEPKYSVG
ncbi:MAG: ABC transporter ATP-binding protein [Candidatus Hydrogenedentes bacterium]|nr:ABC transporter ATP-binding protein [Candidatus Hydrogenedentota bacterium]